MLNLEKHINDLLYLYDCVIVPGLGGFVANKKSAEINDKTGVFSPPRREIGFNKNLSHNDGLLINHIATAEGISYEMCNNKIAKHINILKFQLQKGEVITIGSAGDLKNDPMGNTVFIPKQEESFSTDSFGLTTFHFNTIEQVKDQNAPTLQLVRRTLNAKSTRQIAASVALVLGLLMVSPDFGNQSQQSNFSDMLPKIESNAFTNNNVKTAEKEVTEVTLQEPAATVEVRELEPVAEKVQASYFIIGGSFKAELPAQKHLNKLIKNGITTAEILKTPNRFRISLESFSDKQKATKALKEIRKQSGFNSVWLFTKK